MQDVTDKFIDFLVQKLKKELVEKQKETNIDVFSFLEGHLEEIRDKVAYLLYSDIRSIDTNYEEDPNPLINKKLEDQPIYERGKTKGKIQTEDLWYRSLGPFSKKNLEKLSEAKVGFAGVGASNQPAALILARVGLQKFVLVDDDVFESSNANRQPCCYSSTLGKFKTDATKAVIEDINSQASIKTFNERIDENNVDRFFDGVDYIFDGVDTPQDRLILNKFVRKHGIPLFHSGSSGHEGIYTVFMPDDPVYYEGAYLGWKPKIPYRRGINPTVISMIAAHKTNDFLKLISGNESGIIRFPHVLSVNALRRQPCIVRNMYNMYNPWEVKT